MAERKIETDGVDYNSVKAERVALPFDNTKEIAPKADERVKKKAIVKVKTSHKPGLFKRLINAITGPKGLPDITKYLAKEVILPATKDLAVNSLKTGIDMAFYGGTGQGRQASGWNNPYSRSAGTTTGRVNYGSSYNSYSRGPKTVNAPTESFVDVPEYIIQNREGAVDVLTAMRNDIDQFGRVTVADYYDYVGQPSSSYTDNVYGWTDLHTARIMPVRGGYCIQLPQADVL